MRLAIIFLLFIFMVACAPGRYIRKSVQQSLGQLHDHAGFVLYDPIIKKTLASINGDKYFTPASNTKILSLYAGLKLLGDSVPALRWIGRNDSLIFWGTGDPSFLYADVFQNQRVFNFLKNAPGKLFFSDGNFFENIYGPGWSWDDYQDYYQVERSAFPLYGNLISVSGMQSVEPSFFKPVSTQSSTSESALQRDRFSNKLTLNKNKLPANGTHVVPFITGGLLTAQLLSDTLKREVGFISKPIDGHTKLLLSIPNDSLYKVMMKASDNFIAEQILLLCAQKISDSLKTDIAIHNMLKEFLNDLPDAPTWVDGSGLSRYNQITPRSIVSLWDKIYHTTTQQRLFSLLVSNGQKGTLRNVLKSRPAFIFGKTGSLANHYCLSGYLITKRKRLLIFSSMNANFVEPIKSVRDNLENTLIYIYEHY